MGKIDWKKIAMSALLVLHVAGLMELVTRSGDADNLKVNKMIIYSDSTKKDSVVHEQSYTSIARMARFPTHIAPSANLHFP